MSGDSVNQQVPRLVYVGAGGNIFTLAPGAGATFSLTVNIVPTASGTITNEASVTCTLCVQQRNASATVDVIPDAYDAELYDGNEDVTVEVWTSKTARDTWITTNSETLVDYVNAAGAYYTQNHITVQTTTTDY